MNWPRWTREPLVHFLVAGALAFTFFAWRGEEVDPNSRAIVVGREVQAQLSLRFERTLGRAPTDAELDQQINQYIRDEVLYREALRLGLDQGDPVVRRRLVSKMDLAAGAQAEVARPSDATLRKWFDENAERFATGSAYSFDQLYFEREAGAQTALNELADTNDWRSFGGSISLPASLERSTPREIDTRFGDGFVEKLSAFQTGQEWHGPIQSGFGWHLIRLRELEQANVPDFETVRARVEDEWRSATIAEREEAAYDLLREAYRVEITK